MYDQIYKVVFADGEEFEGGDLAAPKWTKCPDKGIKTLTLTLPFGENLTMEGYEAYNFMVGAMKEVSSGRVSIRHLFLLGTRKGIVTSYRITVAGIGTDKYKSGDITVRKFPLGKEGVGRTATSGWKVGAESE
ncbi:MAG TPA: hypothetical protein VMW36_10865 [Patescibacteria group bacterium]|nr:hypothetical protein [Patescibacteria group bacterium]